MKQYPPSLLKGSQVMMLALACGVIVANLYYAQPLLGLIRADIGLSAGAAGLIVTLTQIGYGVGLLLIVPLGDLVENKRLVVTALLASAVALVGLSSVHDASSFLLGAWLLGLSCVSAQVLVPYAAHLSPPEKRGEMVGRVMSGLLLGIMLARPISSLMAHAWGWRPVFWMSATCVVLLAVAVHLTLPQRTPPAPSVTYPQLLRSMWGLLMQTPILQRRAFYHALLFAAFSLFWSTAPLWLTSPRFSLTQEGVAWFALAGVAGAIAAPIAGRWADRGLTRKATNWALLVSALSFALPWLIPFDRTWTLVLLTAAAILLDMGVSANLVLSQRAIYSLGDEQRGRLNGLFMTLFFVGGATGSGLGVWAYAQGGWAASTVLGAAFPVVAWLAFLAEKRAAQGPATQRS